MNRRLLIRADPPSVSHRLQIAQMGIRFCANCNLWLKNHG